jgi:hypothetical protein
VSGLSLHPARRDGLGPHHTSKTRLKLTMMDDADIIGHFGQRAAWGAWQALFPTKCSCGFPVCRSWRHDR